MRFWGWLKKFFVPSQRNAYRPHILRRRALLFFLALALVSEGALVANLVARQTGNDFLAAVVQSEVISLTNNERRQNNVGTLAENALLDAAAQAKADDMALKGYFAHESPDGKQPWDFIAAAGYDYQYAGENLAVRFVDSQEVVSAWMASPTHRANIVKPAYAQVGVGIAQGIYKGQTATFVVQHFGTPRKKAVASAPLPAARQPATGPAPTTTVVVLGAESEASASAAVAAVSAPAPGQATSFSQTLLRAAGKWLAEPRAATGFVLGGIAALLAIALALAFFLHIQIQAHDLLLPGAAVAAVALLLLVINTRFISSAPFAADGQSAAALYGGTEVVISPVAASDER